MCEHDRLRNLLLADMRSGVMQSGPSWLSKEDTIALIDGVSKFRSEIVRLKTELAEVQKECARLVELACAEKRRADALEKRLGEAPVVWVSEEDKRQYISTLKPRIQDGRIEPKLAYMAVIWASSSGSPFKNLNPGESCECRIVRAEGK